MEDRSSSSFPWSNFLLFVVLSIVLVKGYSMLVAHLRPPAPQQAAQQPADGKQAKEKPEQPAKPAAGPPAGPEAKEQKPAPAGKTAAAEKPAAAKETGKKPGKKPEDKSAPQLEAKPLAQPPVPPKWITLGSVNPADPYRMLVTLSNRGAALARIELASDRYRDLEDRSGYLGHLVMEEDAAGKECRVQVVGAGTPAARAVLTPGDLVGLKPGDRITALNDQAVHSEASLEQALASTEPGHAARLTVLRDGKSLEASVKLTRRPLEVVRPEAKTPVTFLTERIPDAVQANDNCPLGMLATLEQIDDEKMPKDDDPAKAELELELKGVDLRTVCWEIVESDQQHAVFRHKLPHRGLEITKTYRLAEVPEDARANADAQAYHLDFELRIKNVEKADSKKAHDVAYRLDGPNGLPHEGAWYASKVRGVGLRDVLYQKAHGNVQQINCTDLAGDVSSRAMDLDKDKPFQFFAVDAQYFSAAVIPDEKVADRIDRAAALRVGDVDPQWKTITNTSLRITSKPETLPPGGELSHHYVLFAGPKRPDLLAPYGLGNLIYYGWFFVVAKPMNQILEFFYHYIVFNYGLAIILLTVVVRLAMFPLSRKQAMNAQMMQKLQPEIKKLQEKYKKDMEGRTKAQQELFRKHNYNPLGGCLVLFIQLPIFVGLYRSLQVDVELRDASLLSHVVRWCSNLAGPDMLYDWSWFMPAWVNSGNGILHPGPYFNILPLLTIGLFIVQQKMLMPPPADEQAAAQQKMMNLMMIFMGLLFYKVAAGLCIYFIASSVWGVCERKLLPKTAAKPRDDEPPTGRRVKKRPRR
jgi:YidC/Oxa1 family membrane protein insertase